VSSSASPLAPRRVAALYVRVSTEGQAQHGHSLEAQKDVLKGYAKQNGFKYHKVYEDAGHSAKDLNRPDLQRLLSDIERQKVTDILVWRVDRLSRNNLDLLELVEYFKAYKVTLASATEPAFDVSTSAGMFMLSLFANLAQMERDRLVERIQLGKRKRIEQHKWSGSPPFGFTYGPETGTLAIAPEEARIVKAIFRKYQELQTISAVANHLNELGIKPRKAQRWQETSVAKILRNPIYIGRVKQGETEWADKTLRIVSDKVFEACQVHRATRRHLSPKLRETPKSYADGSFCSQCGRHCEENMTYCPGCGAMVRQMEEMSAY
jgi:site-specific DNA recombinase